MCKDVDHGGARCPSDTSEARRLRRKAASIRSGNHLTPAKPTKELSSDNSLAFEAFKAKAEDLRERVYAAPPAGYSQKRYDAKMEKEITKFGMTLADEAQRIAGYSYEGTEDKIRAVGEEIFREQTEKIAALEKERDELQLKCSEIAKEHGLSVRSITMLLPDEVEELSDEEQETLDRLHESRKAIAKQRSKYHQLDTEYDKQKTLIYKEENDKLAVAYQTVIANIRPVGGEVPFNSVGDENVQELVDNTIGKHYPTAWLKAHAEQGGAEMFLTTTNDRAYFNEVAFSETEDDGIEKVTPSFSTLNNLSDPEKQAVVEKVFAKYESNAISVEHWALGSLKARIYLFPDERIHDKYVDEDPTEEGGWEFRPTLASLATPGNLRIKELGKEDLYVEKVTASYWVKKNTTTKKQAPTMVLFSKQAVEDLNKKNNDLTDVAAATAYHEFGHRMETILPDKVLVRQEKAFLQRRSGKTDKDHFEGLVTTGAFGEYGHKANFVYPYVGREYFTGNNYEVFTTGIEALYGGNHGGLIGNSLDYPTKDKDHRGFIMGMLATL